MRGAEEVGNPAEHTKKGDSLRTMQTAYIGMGSNLASPAGNPEATLAAAAARLASLGQLGGRSSLYSTEPVGFADQPRFLNAVVALETDLDAHALLQALLRIEQEFGRDRWASQTEMGHAPWIWIFWYSGTRRISEPGLEIPHPRMEEREFVLIPLLEVASNDQYREQAESGHAVAPNVSEKVPRSIACGRSCSKRCLACSRFRGTGDPSGDGLARAQRRL